MSSSALQTALAMFLLGLVLVSVGSNLYPWVFYLGIFAIGLGAVSIVVSIKYDKKKKVMS